MSRKGVTFEEKKTRMLQLFHEKKDFFQIKELEKIAPKEKGITQNSVKDVVQALVDDGSVDTDKVAGSIYYWSFPSKVINMKKRKGEELQNEFDSSKKKLRAVKQLVAEAENTQDSLKEMQNIYEEINKLEDQKRGLLKQLQTFRESDPKKLGEMEEQIPLLNGAANRWTDNIFTIKSWCKKKFMIEDKILNKQFGIPEDLDYIE